MFRTIVALVIGAVAAAAFFHIRVHTLASIDFRVAYPDVPVEVTTAVKTAEAAYYAEQSLPRRLAEEAEDVLALLAPTAASALDISVGPYRIKTSTLRELLPWAISEGYLTVIDADPDTAVAAISYFSEQPALADWGAALVLERLRLRHPDLRKMSWPVITADAALIAKLYSGYMGAGGDWTAWEATLVPGPEAKRRMRLALR